MISYTRARFGVLGINRKILRFVFTQSRDSEIVDSVKPFNCIPRPPQLPILGNWHLYKLGHFNGFQYQNVLKHLYEKYGPIVVEKIGWRTPIIHVFDIHDVETVYKNEDKSPRIFPLNEFVKAYRSKEKICQGLGQTNDEEWYRLKNGIRDLMLKTSNAQMFLRSVEEVTDDLIDAIREERNHSNNQITNLADLIGRWNIEVGGKVVLNKRLRCLRGSDQGLAREIMKLNHEIFQWTAELKFSLPFGNYIKTPKVMKIMKHEHTLHKIVHKLIKDVIREIREANQNGETSSNKFLQTLLNQADLTEDEMIVIASTLLLDSLSTTNPVLINNLYVLATNQSEQNKIYKQIVKESKNKNCTIDADLLNRLTYLKASIKETFRLYPNGTEIARINKKPLILSNYYIPEGSHLSMNLTVHYRSPKYFPQPEVFKPERWLRDSPLYSIPNSFVLSPFGFGARTCAGRRFADQDLNVALYKILKSFHLSYPKDGPPLESVFRTLIFPQNNIPIQFTPRQEYLL